MKGFFDPDTGEFNAVPRNMIKDSLVIVVKFEHGWRPWESGNDWIKGEARAKYLLDNRQSIFKDPVLEVAVTDLVE